MPKLKDHSIADKITMEDVEKMTTLKYVVEDLKLYQYNQFENYLKDIGVSYPNKNGNSEKDALVSIHDGVRPFISKEIIQKSFDTTSRLGNAVVAVNLKDSIRKKTSKGKTKAENREDY